MAAGLGKSSSAPGVPSVARTAESSAVCGGLPGSLQGEGLPRACAAPRLEAAPGGSGCRLAKGSRMLLFAAVGPVSWRAGGGAVYTCACVSSLLFTICFWSFLQTAAVPESCPINIED